MQRVSLLVWVLLTTITPGLVWASGATQPEPDPIKQDIDTLEHAVLAAAWLESISIETEHGLTWPISPDEPDTISYDLYHGTPGVILFFIELHRATGEARYLEIARRAGDDLLANLAEEDMGLYSGLAGQAFVLMRLGEATGEWRFTNATRVAISTLDRLSEGVGSNIHWNDSTDIISGSAGIGLACLSLFDGLNDIRALGMAIGAGNNLVAEANPGNQPDQLSWPMTKDYPRLMPNFSHGTAGVAFFLAVLHTHLQEQEMESDVDYLEAARAGARRLIALADRESGFRVFHHTPDGEDLFYLNYCHGPAGTARLFARLALADPQGQWGTYVSQCAQTFKESGIPHAEQPGFWNNVGQCCGSAGVVSFLYDADRPGDGFENLKEELLRDLVERGEQAEGQSGLRWPHAEHRVRPELILAQTGYMQGAAGIGLMFLQLDAIDKGREFGGRLPDSPY